MTQISIINITVIPSTTKAGKPYEQLEVVYKDLSYNDTVKSKKIMPFGDSKNVFDALKGSTNGQVFDVQVVKNQAGFNDWIAATPGVAGQGSAASPAPAQAPGRSSIGQQGPAASSPVRANTFETPLERSAKQIYIIRQSSLSTAASALVTGAKSAPKASELIAYAKELESYVLATQEPEDDKTGFDSMDDDVPM